MFFMNEWDITRAVRENKQDTIKGQMARYLEAFRDEVNEHSDGWSYWKCQVQAAETLMQYVTAHANPDMDDFNKALRPIKSFYTRKGDKAGMRRIFFLSDGRMILAHKSTFPDRDRPLVEDHYPKAVKPESKPAAVKWDRLSDGNNLVTALQLIRELCGCTEMNMDDMEQTTLDSLFRAQAFIFHAESHGVKF